MEPTTLCLEAFFAKIHSQMREKVSVKWAMRISLRVLMRLERKIPSDGEIERRTQLELVCEKNGFDFNFI